MLVLVEQEEYYPVLEIEPVNSELGKIHLSNPYYEPIDIPTDLYERYQEVYINFRNV